MSVIHPPSTGPSIGATTIPKAPEGHRLAAILRREGLEQHGLRYRLQAPRRRSLDACGTGSERGQRRRQTAQATTHREPEDRGQQEAFAPESDWKAIR